MRLDWHWWFASDAGLVARIAIGVTLFALLATVDLIRNGRSAQRWREYLFLLATGLAGVAYGAVNDLLTSSISWEYFYYGKGLSEQLGPARPPSAALLRWAAMQIGMKSAGAAALLVGAALLIANNPRAGRPRLGYAQMARYLGWIVLSTAIGGVIFGAAGFFQMLNWTSAELRALTDENLFRPRRFLCTYGVHLGDYLGGTVGTISTLILIGRKRTQI